MSDEEDSPGTALENSPYGSRKFLLSAGALVSATVLVAAGSIGDGVYSSIVLGALAVYVTGNVAQRKVDAKGTPVLS